MHVVDARVSTHCAILQLGWALLHNIKQAVVFVPTAPVVEMISELA